MKNRVSDFRSDTVTRPTEAMRRAMAEAAVGDDVLGDDPTVQRLEALAAETMGKEAALFCPSGTMANSIAVKMWTNILEEVIVEERSHIYNMESTHMTFIAGVTPRLIRSDRGVMDPDAVRAAVRKPNVHTPRTSLICLENTHNRCSGAVLAPAYISRVRALADRHGLSVHMDGARVFNASVALGLPPSELVHGVDSVSFCLSKGLSAPVGSLVCGSAAFIARAHRNRKVLGGAMRQAGVLAAAGIVAIETMVDRLAEDHANARRLAEGLAQVPGILLDPARVPTNIVLFGLAEGTLSARALAASLASRGFLINATGPRQLRAVTHYGIGCEDIDRALSAVNDAMREASAP